ncbi:MAG: DNA-3-methyladenine glycosylase family protein [Hyphomicrobiales bacterium]
MTPDFDVPLAVRTLRAADPALGRLIERVGPCRFRVDPAQSPFHALAESITYQQLHGKAAEAIFARVRALYAPRRFPTPAELLATPDDALRAAGLSRAKLVAMKDLAAKTADGTVPGVARLRRLDDEEIIERLTTIRGVGRWTVEMFLMFRLGRPDVLPVTDFGVRKGYAVAFRRRELPAPKWLAARGARWRPYRSVAAWYLWRAADMGGKLTGGRS